MPMITQVAKKEAIEMLRDGRFRWSASLVLVLLVATLGMGWTHHQTSRAEREAAQQMTRTQWESQPPRNPHGAAHYGIMAIRPAPPLAFVDQGLSFFTGHAVYLEAHYQNPVRYRPAEDTTALARMGYLTAAVVLQLLLPLIIIVLTFSTFAGERERGTLRQLLSLGVPARVLVFGKALGVVAVLGLLLIPATGLGVAVLGLVSENHVFMASLPRLALMGVGYLIYFAALIGVSLGVSAWARSSSASLVTLLGFWVCSSVLLPALVADFAERLFPTPTAAAFAETVRHDIAQGLDGHSPSDERYAAFVQRVLAEYGVQDVEELPVNISGLAYLESEQYSDQVMDKHNAALWAMYQRQQRVHQAGAVLAPFMALRAWSMGWAGTDLAHHWSFAQAAEQYRRTFVRRLNEDLAHNSRYADTVNRTRGGSDYKPGAALWKSMPRFVYTPPGTKAVLAQQAWSLGILLLWVAGSMVAAFAATRRIRV